jgi:alpha-aminoadipate carrier protein LysW
LKTVRANIEGAGREVKGAMAVCPDCEADIEIDEYDVDKGEIISCPECGIDLEVVGLSPLELDVAAQEEDDWEE